MESSCVVYKKTRTPKRYTGFS